MLYVDGVIGDEVSIRDPWGEDAPRVGQGIEARLLLTDFLSYWGRGANQVIFQVSGE